MFNRIIDRKEFNGPLLIVAMIIFGGLGAWLLTFGRAAVSFTITVDAANTNVAPLVRYEQIQNKIQRVKNSNDSNALDFKLLADIGVKYERVFWRPATWSPSEGRYDFVSGDRFNAQDDNLAEMKRRGVVPLITIEGTSNWNRANLNDKAQFDSPSDYVKYTAMLVAGLKHLKEQYPEWQYLESNNEPDDSQRHTSQQRAFETYDAISDAVNQVNNSLPASVPKIKLGGPTIIGYSLDNRPDWLPNFLRHVRDRPGTKFDFISWHYYGPNPADYSRSVNSIKTLTETTEFSQFAGMEQYITEWGSTPATNEYTALPSKTKLANEAAFFAAGYYQFMESRAARAYEFAQSDYVGYPRSVLVPQQNTGLPDSVDPAPGNTQGGLVYPKYNVMKMFSMIPDTRVSSTNALNARGHGLGSIAAKDDDTLSVLLWNHREGGAPVVENDVILQLKNLPPALQNKPLVMRRYLVDESHSNYPHAVDTLKKPEKQFLEQLPDVKLPAGGANQTVNVNQTLSQYAVVLVVVEPDKTVEPPEPPEVPKPQASKPIEFGMYVGGTFHDYKDEKGNVIKTIYFPGGCARGRWLFNQTDSDCVTQNNERSITHAQFVIARNPNVDPPKRLSGESDTNYKPRIESFVKEQITKTDFVTNVTGFNHIRRWIDEGKAAGLDRTVNVPLAMSFRSYAIREKTTNQNPEELRYSMAANLAEGAKSSSLWKAKYEAIGRTMVKNHIYRPKLRVGWEADGNWFQWQFAGGEPRPAGGCTDSNRTTGKYCINVDNWKQFFINIRQWILDGANAQADAESVPRSNLAFEFVWNMDVGVGADPENSSTNSRDHPEDSYPGDAYVDTIGLEVYCSRRNSLTYPQSTCFNDKLGDLEGAHGLTWFANFAKERSKPIAFPEWGIDVTNAGDDPGFVYQMHNWMKSNNVIWHSAFDAAPSDDRPRDFMLCPSPFCTEGTHAPNASAKFKELFSQNMCSNGGTPSSTTSRTWTCTDSGSPPSTEREVSDRAQFEAAANDLVNSGGTILLKAGNYPQLSVTDKKYVQKLTIKAVAGQSVKVDGFIIKGTSNLDITGLELTNGIDVLGRSEQLVFSNLNIVSKAAPNHGLSVIDSSSNIELRDSKIKGGLRNIRLYGGFSPSTAPWLSNIRIINNELSFPTEDNIQITGANDVVIEKNFIHDPNPTDSNPDNHNDGVQVIAGQNIQILGNEFTNPNGNGTADQGIIISQRDVYGTEPQMVIKNILIANNLIHHWSGSGITIAGGDDISVVNNTSYDNREPTHESYGLLITERAKPAQYDGSNGERRNNNLRIWNNIFSIMGFSGTSRTDPGLVLESHNIVKKDGGGQNLITADPQFASVDPNSPNKYKLKDSSPAINSGLSRDNTPTVDWEAKQRINTPDRGAREFEGTNPRPPKRGDFDLDDKIDNRDLDFIFRKWRKPATATEGDLNGDGQITLVDLSMFLKEWGR